jgi:hypothetical protein
LYQNVNVVFHVLQKITTGVQFGSAPADVAAVAVAVVAVPLVLERLPHAAETHHR